METDITITITVTLAIAKGDQATDHTEILANAIHDNVYRYLPCALDAGKAIYSVMAIVTE